MGILFHNTETFQNNKRTASIRISLFLLGVILSVTALIIGVADNLPVIILLFAGLICSGYALIMPWKNPVVYLKLFGMSLIGFIISVLLHNGTDALAAVFDNGLIQSIFYGLSGFFFILAVIVFPVLGFLGLIGYLLKSIKTLIKDKD